MSKERILYLTVSDFIFVGAWGPDVATWQGAVDWDQVVFICNGHVTLIYI